MKKFIVIGVGLALLIVATLLFWEHSRRPSDTEIRQKVPGGKSENGQAAAARRVCIGNLREIDAGENEWALENHKNIGDVPTKQDLLPYVRSWPVCPSGGTYTINAVGTPPTCSISGHAIPTNK